MCTFLSKYCTHYIWFGTGHNQVCMVVADGLVPVRHQAICSHSMLACSSWYQECTIITRCNELKLFFIPQGAQLGCKYRHCPDIPGHRWRGDTRPHGRTVHIEAVWRSIWEGKVGDLVELGNILPSLALWAENPLDMWLCARGSGILHIDGLVQERSNSSALAMELRLSCTYQQ